MAYNRLPFSPLTDEALIGAMIHEAAFGGEDGYVTAHELAEALSNRNGLVTYGHGGITNQSRNVSVGTWSADA